MGPEMWMRGWLRVIFEHGLDMIVDKLLIGVGRCDEEVKPLSFFVWSL